MINIPRPDRHRETIIAGIGIALEYYSIFLFGYLSFLILPYFFLRPSSFLLKLAIILEAIMGILGTMLCGHIGDTLGRKKILVYTIACVALPSFIISILPGYESIGITASLVFIMLRSIQMLAFGGDEIGLVTFILEDIPANQRGRFGGYMSMGAGIGVCLACLFVFFSNPFAEPAVFWKWRLLLIFGVFGLFIANYLKKTFGETAVFRHFKMTRPITTPPLFSLFKTNKIVFLKILGITVLAPIITIVIFGWVPQFSVKHLGLPSNQAMLLNAGALFLFSLGAPIFGNWSDRLGRKRVLLGVSLFFLIFSPLLVYLLANTTTVMQFFCIEAILTFAASAYYGVAMTASIEHVPTHIRYTGVAVAYYINYAIFGGVSGNHIDRLLTGSINLELAPVFYLMIGSAIVFISSSFLNEEARHELSDDIK
ncbi:MAG TPA: MFS transporter [Chlamydiales bacterium]|nr:MFS transporter [Chlamydiales bacterium]